MFCINPDQAADYAARKGQSVETTNAGWLPIWDMTRYNGIMAKELVLEPHIVATPGIRSGKPRLDGTRITVADVVTMHLRMGQSLEEIAGDYDLSLAAIHAAMAYYYDHRDEIEASIAENQRFADDLSPSRKSLLQEKLADTRA